LLLSPLIGSIARAGDQSETSRAPAAGETKASATASDKPDPRRSWRYDRHYVDKKNGNALRDALVCLSGSTLKGAAPAHIAATAVVDQKDFTFIPETLAIRAGDKVKFKNSDPGTHNVFTRDELHPFDVTLGNADEAVETFPRAGGSRRPVAIGCQFHGSMRAWIFVFDHPWYALTAKDGRYSLKNVPPGVYHLEVAHPAGQLRFSKRVEVVAGETLKLDISLSPDHKIESKK
jgi:plastocyanin